MNQDNKPSIPENVPEKEKLWTEQEAADYLNLSVQTMRHRRVHRQPPTFLKLGRTVRYRRQDLDACLTEFKAKPAGGSDHV